MLSHTDVQSAIRGKKAQTVSSLVGGQGEPRHHRMSHPWQDDVFLVEVKLAAEFCRDTLCHQHIENGWFYLQHSSLRWGFQGLSRDTWGTDDWEMYKYVTRTAGNLCLQQLRSSLTSTDVPFSRLILKLKANLSGHSQWLLPIHISGLLLKSWVQKQVTVILFLPLNSRDIPVLTLADGRTNLLECRYLKGKTWYELLWTGSLRH